MSVVGTLVGAKEKSHPNFTCKWLIFSDPRGIQTPNLLIRSQLLYSVELWGQCLFTIKRFTIYD